jgi:glycosyltransferase involved in cell wall biosynthesis
MMESAGKVLMLVENAYPRDPRVKNEAEALTDVGYSVSVVGLQEEGQPRFEVINRVRVYRLPRLELFKKVLHENLTKPQRLWIKLKSLVGYICEYTYFTSACFAMSLYVAYTDGFEVIHAHNPPDLLFLIVLPWKLMGKRYVFDQHDLCPELYRSRYGANDDVVAALLRWIEWANLRLADITIATNESYKQIQIQRGGRKPETVFVVRNGPDRGRMQIAPPSKRLRDMGKSILVYIGSLNPQDGVDYLLRSLKHLVYDLKREDFYCVIIGKGDSLADLQELRARLELTRHVELTGYIPDWELQENLAAADICVDPDPSSPLNDVSTWIKVMEYMAYGKPIVSFDLKETRVSAQGAALFVPCNDELAFANAIVKLMDDGELREQMGRLGRERVEGALQWSVVSKNLLAAYAALFATG